MGCAILRVCASCKWIFKGLPYCPKCGFVHYSARYVFGNKCYSYAVTQEPWLKDKLDNYEAKLRQEIDKTNDIKKVKESFGYLSVSEC